MPQRNSKKSLPSARQDPQVKDAVAKLEADEAALRIQGAGALGRMGDAAEPAVIALTKLFDDKNTKVAEAAAAALRDIGPAARKAVPALMDYLDDGRRQFRYFVHAALKRIGPAAFGPLSARLLDNPQKCSAPFRDCFIFMGLTCFDELLPLLEHEDSQVRRIAYHAMGHCNAENRPRAIELLTEGLSDSSRAVRNTAQKQLRQEAFFAREKSLAPTLRKAARQGGTTAKPVAKDLLERLSPQDFQAEHASLLQQFDHKLALGRVAIPSELLVDLELTRWSRLSAARRKGIQAAITTVLTESGYKLREEGVLRYGPQSDAQPIAVWRDESDLRFVLIPGGTFQPGFGEAQLEHLERAVRQLEGAEFPLNPKRLPVFGDGWCNLLQKKATRIRPLLMAGELVSAPAAKRTKRHDSRLLTPDLEQLAALLKARRWSLPSSHEFEWGVLGGRETIFHWGNRPGKFIRQERVQACHDDQRWPYCTRFGLTAPLSHVTWCLPQKGQKPLVTRGGATTASPWQACMEWMLYLNAVFAKQAIITDYGQRFTAAVRPVIRLGK